MAQLIEVGTINREVGGSSTSGAKLTISCHQAFNPKLLGLSG